MSTLLVLPTELLRLILSALANVSIESLFIIRLTCHTIHDVVTDILNISTADHGLAIHKFLIANFSAILDTSTVEHEHQPSSMETYAPYSALPWSVDTRKRHKWDREEASWRRIPLTSPSGKLVQTLQVVYQNQLWYPGDMSHLSAGTAGYRCGWEDAEQYWFPKGWPVGLLFDLMIEYTDSDLREWKVLFDAGIRDELEFKQFLARVDKGDRPGTADVMRYFGQKDNYAILLIGTSRSWAHYEGPWDRVLWCPDEVNKDGYFWRDIPRREDTVREIEE